MSFSCEPPAKEGGGRGVPPLQFRHYFLYHQVMRLASNESLEIGNQLIGQCLHCFLAGPGDVRRQNKVRQVEVKQWVSLPRWLITQNIESGSGDLTGLQGRYQSSFVYQTTTRSVNQQRASLHC